MMLRLKEGGDSPSRGGEGGRELRTFFQRWLWERPRDSSDASSPLNGLVSNGGEGEFNRFFFGLQ
jgi:hypothetical protein